MCNYVLHKEAAVLEAYTRTERVSGPNLAVPRPGILLLSLLIALFFATKCFAQPAATVDSNAKPIQLEGSVLTGDAAAPSYAVGAKVEASGPVTVETETDNTGSFIFGNLPAGTYTLIASEPGLEAQQTVTLR